MEVLRKILLTCLIGIIIITVVLGEYFFNQEQNKIIDQKNSNIFPLVSRFETDLQDTISLVEITAQLPEVINLPFSDQIVPELHGIKEDQDIEKRQIARSILVNKENVKAVYFAMPNADMYMIEPYELQKKVSSNNFAFRDWYNGILKTKTLYISELFSPQGVDVNSVSIVTPVKKSGNFVGIWGVLINLDSWNKQFDEIKLDENENIFIIDHKGNPVIESKQNSVKATQSYLEMNSVKNALDGKGGGNIETVNGVNYFVTYAPVTVGPHTWALIIIEPYDDIIAKSQIIRVLYVMILLILACAFVGFIIYRNRILKYGVGTFGKFRNIEFDIVPLDEQHPLIIEKKSNSKVYFAIIASLLVILTAFAFVYEQPPQTKESLKTLFLIQNLKGDTVDTWMNWKIMPDEKFHIHVQQSPDLNQHRLDIINDAIFSEESIQIDDSLMHKGSKGSTSTYYMGWTGAIKSISKDTRFTIPIHFHPMVTQTGEGNIVIRLSELKNPDGYSGYTKTFVDDENHQILKSDVTIYNVDSLSDVELATIVRHELGHAFGLAHSTAPEDLMYTTIETNYPYISPCDIDALVGLYDGKTKSQVVCEK